MKKIQTLIQSGVIVLASLLIPCAALAHTNNQESIPSVAKLKNLNTTDWQEPTFQHNLLGYKCSQQWQRQPNNQPLTRYQFIVGLHHCLQKIEKTLSPRNSNNWQKIQQNSSLELKPINNKIKQLEANQFSTTTKFNAQTLFFLTAADESETTFGYRTRLNFDSSFEGDDLLRIRLENRNLPRLDETTDTSMSRLSVDGDTDNQTELSELSYTFSQGDRTQINLGTTGVSLNDVGEVLNPFASSSSGAVSRFARRDPATLRAPGGAGIGIKQQFSEEIGGFAGYFIDNQDVANAQAGRGIFRSSQSAIAQIVIQPEEELILAATYTHTYQRNNDVNLMGATGVATANQPFEQNATTSDNFGLQANWQVTSGLEIGGWFGYTHAQQQANGNAKATILNGALTLALPDFGAENNLAGIIIGIPPVISQHDDADLVTREIPLHIEALYRIKVNDYLEITPGGFIVINPDPENANTLWVATVRTEFSF
ncbi:hypothetical protein NIES4102_10230 [Chondrocystis sp. NIES-4102]|nr:hypothetical protein NIES4102_10230 [Chondrocystis sp. NIES-4102]